MTKLCSQHRLKRLKVVLLLVFFLLQMISDWKGLRRSFKKMDISGDGFVSATDFKAAMLNFKFPLHEEDFFHIFSVFDENMEGRVSYVEFMKRSLSV